MTENFQGLAALTEVANWRITQDFFQYRMQVG